MSIHTLYSGKTCEAIKTNAAGDVGCRIVVENIPNSGFEFDSLLMECLKTLNVRKISGFVLKVDWAEVSKNDTPGLEGIGFRRHVKRELKKYKNLIEETCFLKVSFLKDIENNDVSHLFPKNATGRQAVSNHIFEELHREEEKITYLLSFYVKEHMYTVCLIFEEKGRQYTISRKSLSCLEMGFFGTPEPRTEETSLALNKLIQSRKKYENFEEFFGMPFEVMDYFIQLFSKD